MATDNDTKLTRYTSAVTIVTADTMNKLYGGEFGFNETVGEFDPLVYGHVHDGKHQDGHASKILLTSGAHVRGYLGNANLGGTNGTTPAVRYSNILCYSEATFGSPAARRAAAAAGGYDLEILAIPEYVEIDGDKCYYLDLSNSAGGVDGSVQFNEAGAFGGNSDLFYDYTSMLLGLGTNTPARKLHVVGDGASPPIRVENVTEIGVAGTGKTLVFDSTTGDFYTDVSVSGAGAFETTANVTSNSPGDLATDDFVFGSDSLDEDGTPEHRERFLFDKDKYAIRAGRASSTQFDDSNRGEASAAFGEDPVSQGYGSMTFGSYSSNQGAYSGILSGDTNLITDPNTLSSSSLGESCVIAGGLGNQINIDNVTPGGKYGSDGTIGSGILAGIGNRIYATAPVSAIVSGQNSNIGSSATPGDFSEGSFIGGGDFNIIGSSESAPFSSIVGGEAHQINSKGAFVGGGSSQEISGGDYSAIVGGENNLINSSGSRNFIGGGGGTLASDANEITGTATQAAIVGGKNNVINDNDSSFIGGGEDNDINSTTGFLSVIVGGRSHAISDTASVSFIGGGLANTINGSATHGVIAGGQENTLTDGDHNLIGGGRNNRITSTQDRNSIVGGFNNLISGTASQSVIAGGQDNTISSNYAFIGGGDDNAISTNNYISILGGTLHTASGLGSAILGGYDNDAAYSYSVVSGSRARAEGYGSRVHSAGSFSIPGDAQIVEVIWRIETTDGTANVEMFLDGFSERFVLDPNSMYVFDILVAARRADLNNEGKAYRLTGAIDNNAGTAALIGTVTKTIIAADAAASAWDCQATADAGNNALKLDVSGEPSKRIRWVAHGRIVKVFG